MAAQSGPPVIRGLTFRHLLSSSGGYGDVYLYREDRLGREVAVKVLRDRTLDELARQRFETEATTMAGLQHPNVVTIHSVGVTDDDRAYIVMAYCPEATFSERAVGGELALADVLSAAIEVSGALHSAHLAGIIHRDVKPANILTQPWGGPGLTDFGVATTLTPTPEDDEEVGVSIPWSSPEMLFTETRGSVATDVYSLGATVWHLLVGRSPFEVLGGDNSRIGVMGRIRDLQPPRTGRADVPDSLERILARAMAKKPELRHPSAAAFAQALTSVESEQRLPRTRMIVTHRRAPGMYAEIADDALAKTRVRRSGAAGPGAPGQPKSKTATTGAGAAQRSRPLGAGNGHTEATGPSSSEAQSRANRSASARRVGRLEAPIHGGTTLPPPRAVTQTSARRGPLTLKVVGALLGVAAAVGVGYAVVARDSPQPSRATLTEGTVTPDAGSGVAGLPPGPVAITWTRTKAEVTFRWTYSAQLATDTFRWRTDDDREGVVKIPTLTLKSAARQPICLAILVVRQDGGGSVAYSPPVCAD